MLKRAVRTVSEAVLIANNEKIEMPIPVMTVIILDVCLGRRLKNVMRFFPRCIPTKSPAQATKAPTNISVPMRVQFISLNISNMRCPPFASLSYYLKKHQSA